MPVAVGPDFICVGMPKAGTGWLFDQLQYHPDFWIPPCKEIFYLDREFPRLGNALRLLEIARQSPRRLKRRLAKRRPWDERDHWFLEYAESISGQAMDLGRYAALFERKGGLISGDITPHYSALPDEIVAQVGRHLPETRVLLLVRDPIDRAWSQISMSSRSGKFDQTLLGEPDKFRSFLVGAKHIAEVSLATEIASRWARCAPRIAFRHVFFDDIATRPELARREILVFLGADPEKPSGEIPPDHNRKSKFSKLPLPDAIRRVMAEHFEEELRDAAALFGGHARTWLANYGF